MSYSPEMLNELKRLQDVITQLQSSNTNLTGVITELQNQVAQQTITNTNLTNVLTELQTQVTRLTTITGQLVTVNIRALNQEDIAHDPLPYEIQTLMKNDWAINNGGYQYVTYSDNNWGQNKDFYAQLFTLHINTSSAIFETISSGMEIYLYEATDAVPRWGKSYTVHAGNLPMIRYGNNRRVLISEDIRFLRLDYETDALAIIIYNYSGYTLAPDTCISYYAI